MKLNEITEKGLYATDRRTIYQVYENDGKDFKEHPLLMTTWKLENVKDDRREYEDPSGCDIDVRYADDIEVKKLDDKNFKYEYLIGGSAILVENKLTYKEKLELIEQYCKEHKSNNTADILNIIRNK